MLLIIVAVVLVTALVVFPGPIPKIRAFLYGAYYMVWSHDVRSAGGSTFFRPSGGSPEKDRTVRVIFVRHGQSHWNSIINKLGLLWPVRLVRLWAIEWIFFWLRPRHSLVIDSPLSSVGRREAKTLSDFARTAKDLSLDARTSMVVSSNLRRAMETAVVGLSPRLQQTGERIFVDSFLQEATRQIDAQSFCTTPGRLSDSPLYGVATREALIKSFDPAYNLGTKDIKSNVITRTSGFVSRLFDLGGVTPYAPAGGRNEDLRMIMVVGHSGWFRFFFRRFLPVHSGHISKKRKIRNGAAVSFDLTYRAATGEVSIDESSIKEMYLGFL